MIIEAKIQGKNYDPAQYRTGQDRAKPGDPRYTMSYSTFKEFARNPHRWVSGYKSPSSSAMEWGNILDCVTLSPERLESKYIIKPDEYTDDKGNVKPWNGNATYCKQWAESAESRGLTPVKADLVADANSALKRMTDEPNIAEYLRDSDKQIALTGIWHDKETGIDIPIQSLVDLAPTFESIYAGTLGDLKSARTANPELFVNQVFQLGYHIQAALYLALWNAATGESRSGWNWIVSESFHPFEACAIMASPDMIVLGQQTLNRIVADYAKCIKTQIWPGYKSQEQIEGWSVIYPKPWMMTQEFFADSADGAEKELPF